MDLAFAILITHLAYPIDFDAIDIETMDCKYTGTEFGDQGDLISPWFGLIQLLMAIGAK